MGNITAHHWHGKLVAISLAIVLTGITAWAAAQAMSERDCDLYGSCTVAAIANFF